MVDVDFTPGGQADLAALPLDAQIDVLHKLELVEQVGLAGELIIGEIAPVFPIYLLYAGHHHIGVAYDGRAGLRMCSVFAIKAYALTDLTRKATFLNDAMREMGIRGSRVVVL